MFCRNCGKEIGDGNKFCGYCGSVIASRLVANTPAAEEPTVCGTADNIKASPTANGVTCLYPPYDTYVQPKTDKKAKRIVARVLAIVCILINLLIILGSIINAMQVYNYYPESSLHYIIFGLFLLTEVVLLLVFLIRKKEGYSGLIAAVAWVGILLSVFSDVVLFELDTYIYANETLAVKISNLVLGFITMPVLWLFIGSVIKRPVEKMAAVLHLAGVVISYTMQFVIYYDMESAVLSGLLLNVACEIPLIILLFIYPVLSKPIRKQK